MELMTAQPRPGRTQASLTDQASVPVAEVQLPPSEAGRDAQKASHRMDDAAGVDQRRPQHHVSAALAVNRACLGETAQTIEEPVSCGKPARVQFGVSAGQPASIATVIR